MSVLVKAHERQRTSINLWVELFPPGECPIAGQEPGRWATVTSGGRLRNWESEIGATDYIAMLREELAMLWKEIA